MKITARLSCALLAAGALAACGRSEPRPEAAPEEADTTLADVINVGSLALSRDAVILRAPDHPQARIEAGGRLVIDGHEVPVDETQRAGLSAYHATAMQLREHARDTGIAGAKVGIAAVGAVIDGLTQGEPEGIGPKVEAEAAQVKQAALAVCDDLLSLRETQESLAASLEAFRPYATIDKEDVENCRSRSSPDEPPPAMEVPVSEAPGRA